MSFAAIGITSAVISTGIGAATAISADQKQKKAQRRLDELARNSPIYKQDKSINDYYQQALNRFNENPYQSQQYQLGAMNARRATAQGIGALQDRRSAIGGIARLAGGQNAALQNLGAQAEAQKAQRFSQYGSATQMKSADTQREFDINKMTPYNRFLQLEQMKGAAAGEQLNAGLSMVGQGLGAAGSYAALSGGGKIGKSGVDKFGIDKYGNYTGSYGSITG